MLTRRGFLGGIFAVLAVRRLPKPKASAPSGVAGIVLPDGRRIALGDWTDDKLYSTISFSDTKMYLHGLVRRDVA